MSTPTPYQILKRDGSVIEFATTLTVPDAARIVGGLPRQTEFTISLVNSFHNGRLSESQSLWLLKLAHDATKPPTDGPFARLVGKVREMQARAKGRVTLRLDGVTVKAVTKGANEGSCYLYRGDEYAGKLTPSGELFSSYGATLTPLLEGANEDPVAAARQFGYLTGNCSCCGRTLTDPVSVYGGIGPVCLERLDGPEARKQLQREYNQHKAAA